MLKNKKGITLIALVITIIVLLILAGVALSALMGDSGIMTNAEKAKENTSKGNTKEQLGLAVQQALIEGEGEIKNATHLNDELNRILGTTGESYVAGEKSPFTVTVGGNNFKIESTGSIKELEKPRGTYASAPKDSTTGVLSEGNATFIIDGLTAVIPKGFKVVNGSEGEQSIAKGLVIQDAKRNEFVWVPVTYEATGELDENGLDSGFKSVFTRNTTDEKYAEPYTDGYTNEDGTTEADDYNNMMLSVQKNKGFYIGRYEAGTNTARYRLEADKATMKANGESEVIIQKGAYPYDLVAWGKEMNDYVTPIKFDFKTNKYSESGLDQGRGAVYLSKHLLDGQTTGAISTLCYGVQWDAMLNFISTYDVSKDINDGTSWGNYRDSNFTFTGKYSSDSGTTWNNAIGEEKPTSTSWVLTTGASERNKAQNIYDISGNIMEWTMEMDSSNSRRINRGGGCNFKGLDYSATKRNSSASYICFPGIGFRPALYITNQSDLSCE